ncbi:MAG TPA: glycoside hydrolase family 3 N-terminal domain-containing protein [Gemmatimonadaceae bacterium]|nr:glycoside hydrolase family 3 N-terminal domain-containing protein [Gemmatimonadaceae bacterium]
MPTARHALAAALLLAACAAPPVVTTTTPVSPADSTPVVAVPTNLAPGTPLTAAQQRWVDSTLAGLTVRQRVGQMVWRWVLGDYASTGDSSLALALGEIRELGIGGVTMSLGSPIEVAAKINTMQRASHVPLIVSSDLEPGLGRLEGGVFSHYLTIAGGATVFPQAMAIAATGREQDAHDVGNTIAREARAVGIQINFAPTVDVNNNPSNPVINVRSFGEDPQRVAALASAFVRGSMEAGVVATAKHFPGHGDTDVDSHVGLPVVGSDRAQLDTVELVPFRAAIAAGAPMVMTAHLALPAVLDSATPATLAPTIMTNLLRDSLGFEGTTITDALTMEGVGKGYTQEESAVMAVKAGVDVLLMPRDARRAIDAVVAAVESGEIPAAAIERSVRRILELKARTGVAFAPITDLERLRTVVGAPEHRALANQIAERAITLIKDSLNLVPVTSGRVVVVQYMPETELKAGRRFQAELQAGGRGTRVFKITPRSGAAELDSIAAIARGADRVILAAHVRRVEGEGRNAIPEHIATWMNGVAGTEKVVFIALGNPYLIRQLPAVGSYLVTFGVGEALERAAARAVTGQAPIGGKSPVSLPGFFTRGAGLTR